MLPRDERTIGLFGATSIGVGAIVGGGILALAGTALALSGPGALVAFALNGAIALLTALSFAELSTLFPHSGGIYTFAKRVLSVRNAFTIGWLVYFASIVAGVLYALGFAEYAVVALKQLWAGLLGPPPEWFSGRPVVLGLAMAAVGAYTIDLTRRSGGGGDWATIGKVMIFGVIIAGGLWAVARTPLSTVQQHLTPFFSGGLAGVFQAMGFTFIAFQGFDFIATAAGEIRSPGRNIPRAMILSLLLALVIYLPLLWIIITAGVPQGEDIVTLSQRFPSTIIAVAMRSFLGAAGFWLVVVAALLAMLSALQANLFAASRIAYAMARDRTLPKRLCERNAAGLPANAVLVSSVALIALLILLPDVATAGAAASLIFLTLFTLAHGIGVLARRRSSGQLIPFRTPLFPLVPLAGGLLCAALAAFQGIAVPPAGLITLAWIILGLTIYLRLFAARARAVDALQEARDPQLVQLRGRSPLVLAPIANPANAKAMVTVANALATTNVGRVLLLSIVTNATPDDNGEAPMELLSSQSVLRESLLASFDIGLYPEALTTLADNPWSEIARVARSHRCESLLLGLSNLADETIRKRVNQLISGVDSDVVVLRAPPGWRLEAVRSVLIPIGGRNHQEELRARLLGSLSRLGNPEVTYFRVVPKSTTEASLNRARRALRQLAEDRATGTIDIEVLRSDTPLQEISDRACHSDLLVLGLQRFGRKRKMFGTFARDIVARTDPNCAIIMISQRG